MFMTLKMVMSLSMSRLTAVTPDAWCRWSPLGYRHFVSFYTIIMTTHRRETLLGAKGEKLAKLIFNQQNHYANDFN